MNIMKKIGIADTTFSRVDMASFALDTIKKQDARIEIVRYTVPGIKDLPVACTLLFKQYKCDLVMSLGMVGKEAVDKTCGHEASLGHQCVQIIHAKHIMEVFVHMDEAHDDKDLFELTKDRVTKHAINALELLKGPHALSPRAGTGRRQGRTDVGRILLKE